MADRQTDRDLGQARQFLTLVLCAGSPRPQGRDVFPGEREQWSRGPGGLEGGHSARGRGHCMSKGLEVGQSRNVGGWRDPGQGKHRAVTSLTRAKQAGSVEKFREAFQPGLG